jgi:hypothetical protein
MSTADDQVQCPHCQVTFRRRDIHATTYTVHKCRSCGSNFELEEQWAWRDEEAILQEDVSAIDAWLAQVSGLEVQRVRDRESMGEFLWSVVGLPFPWRCEAVYDKARPNVVVVRLRSEVSAPGALPDAEGWEAACVSRGVQTSGMKGAKPWWGAAQALLTVWLRPTLFRPVVDRLDEVLREVASHSRPG